MRRLPALLTTSALIVLLAACTSGGAPGWTYAPAPSATPVASGGASGAPGASASGGASAPASTAPSTAPSAGGSPVASGGTGSTLTIKAPVGAATAGFDPTTAQAAANTAFQLIFDNEDNQAPHNLILQNPDGSNVQVGGDTAFFTGPGQRTYQVPALAPGDYKYMCQVHPTTMNGVLTIK